MTHYGLVVGTFQTCQTQLMFYLASSEALCLITCAGHFGILVCPALYPKVYDSHLTFILISETEKHLKTEFWIWTFVHFKYMNIHGCYSWNWTVYLHFLFNSGTWISITILLNESQYTFVSIFIHDYKWLFSLGRQYICIAFNVHTWNLGLFFLRLKHFCYCCLGFAYFLIFHFPEYAWLFLGSNANIEWKHFCFTPVWNWSV